MQIVLGVTMLALHKCTTYAMKRSWLGPVNLMQFQDLPSRRDSFGFTSAGEKIFIFGGLANNLGVYAARMVKLTKTAFKLIYGGITATPDARGVPSFRS